MKRIIAVMTIGALPFFLQTASSEETGKAIILSVDQGYLLDQTVWPTPDLMIFDHNGDLLYRQLGFNSNNTQLFKNILTNVLINGENIYAQIPEDIKEAQRSSLILSHVTRYKSELSESGLNAKEQNNRLNAHKERVSRVINEGAPSLNDVYSQSNIDPSLRESIRANDSKTLVLYHADWCQPCQEIAPLVESFVHHHNLDVIYLRIERDYTKLN